MPKEFAKLPDWLAVPELGKLPFHDQAAIVNHALQCAHAKHPPGFNLPALLSAMITSIATMFALGVQRPGAGWHWWVFAPIAAVEFIGSIFFGFWWWRAAYSREFRKVVRMEIAKLASA